MSLISDLEHVLDVVPKLEEEVARQKAILDQVAALIPAPVGPVVEDAVNVVADLAPQAAAPAVEAPLAVAVSEPAATEEPAAATPTSSEAGNPEQAGGVN